MYADQQAMLPQQSTELDSTGTGSPSASVCPTAVSSSTSKPLIQTSSPSFGASSSTTLAPWPTKPASMSTTSSSSSSLFASFSSSQFPTGSLPPVPLPEGALKTVAGSVYACVWNSYCKMATQEQTDGDQNSVEVGGKRAHPPEGEHGNTKRQKKALLGEAAASDLCLQADIPAQASGDSTLPQFVHVKLRSTVCGGLYPNLEGWADRWQDPTSGKLFNSHADCIAYQRVTRSNVARLPAVCAEAEPGKTSQVQQNIDEEDVEKWLAMVEHWKHLGGVGCE
eukprot:TRINITY_DN86746_c0_g1_i1.p1 TRINITY_DN86746_c0_g1~~TRINITY_DN86746_c0_g1_i1.p1  ORF type:complete len:312 (+),score=32.58 TRINITY_DN86746_c0_g1_i1:95-937(+)